MHEMSASDVLVALLLAGLLGMVGQGVRALAGLKKLVDSSSAQAPGQGDVFLASRLIVSLLIGFIAGVVAGIGVLDKLVATKLPTDLTELLLGLAAAGYIGTDFVEAFVGKLASRAASSPAAAAGGAPALPPPAGAAPAGDAPASPGAAGGPVTPPVVSPRVLVAPTVPAVRYESLVPGGSFSADPEAPNTPRSIRTNNPGALNFRPWQRSRPGFVGVTQPDESPNHNVTSIYRTPEHGVAAWYFLISRLYNFSGGTFSVAELAARYAGTTNSAAVSAYVQGWSRWSAPPILAGDRFTVTDTAGLLPLARAMFSHEAGIATPLHDDQIRFAIDWERAGTLPA